MTSQTAEVKRKQKTELPARFTRQQASGPGVQTLSASVTQRAINNPATLTPAQVMTLQRSMGNQAVAGLLGRGQGSRQSSQPSRPALVQAKSQGKSATTPSSAPGREGGSVTQSVETDIQRAKGSGHPIDAGVRTSMESRFGANFQGVRIHTDAKADRLSRSVNARAFTTGSDIFFQRNEYSPTSSGGQKLLAHELTHTIQQGAITGQQGAIASGKVNRKLDGASAGTKISQDAPADTGMIQRKMGFEIETGIPITAYGKDKEGNFAYWDPGVNVGEDEIVQIPWGNLGSALSVDHIPGHEQSDEERFGEWPIIEFVSRAVPEDDTPDQFRYAATQWLNLLVHLRQQVNATPPPKPLEDTLDEADDELRIGYPRAESKKLSASQLDRVAIQATMGTQLSRMGQLMGTAGNIPQELIQKGVRGYLADAAKAAKEAIEGVDKVLPKLTDKYSSPYKNKKNDSLEKQEENRSNTERDKEELRGFLMMITNYLAAGRIGKSGYIKNQTALFYKSKLSDVRNKLIETNPYAEKVLNHWRSRSWLKEKLLKATGRTSKQRIFEKDTLKCGDWVSEVLKGTDDKVFESGRNPWSKDIKPEKVSGKLSAVVEMRSPGTYFPQAEPFKLSTDKDEIIDYLVELYKAGQPWQGVDPQTEDEDSISETN